MFIIYELYELLTRLYDPKSTRIFTRLNGYYLNFTNLHKINSFNKHV